MTAAGFTLKGLRARRTKVTSALRPGDNEDGQSAQQQVQLRIRQESSQSCDELHVVSSTSKKQLLSFGLQPVDAQDRLRRTQEQKVLAEGEEEEDEEEGAEEGYVNDQNDGKYRDNVNDRQPMDTTLELLAKEDCPSHVKVLAKTRVVDRQKQDFDSKRCRRAKEWRLGYNNRADTGSRAGIGDTFEPRESTRERILDLRNAPDLLPNSVVVAYPYKRSQFLKAFAWQTKRSNQMDNRREIKKKPWCPASSCKLPDATSPRRRKQDHKGAIISLDQEGKDSGHSARVNPKNTRCEGLQKFPIRTVEAFDRNHDTEQEDVVVDARNANRQQRLLTKVVEVYTRARARLDCLKDPHMRYLLPIEDETQHPRAYRLGLENMPSTKPKKRNDKPRFRPKSAHNSLGLQKSCLGLKADNPLTSEPIETGKVAGARRRPHSANIAFLKHSTVYCMESPMLECASVAADFRKVIDIECRKRERERTHILHQLATRGLLHSIPLAQVFARLRREGLLNIDRRQRNTFEQMTLIEYMSACGFLNYCGDLSSPTLDTNSLRSSSATEVKLFDVNLTDNGLRESKATSSANASSTISAIRKALVVSRQQFHLALEAFNLSSTDVNLLFSALDLSVSDHVQVWDVIHTVEMLQHEHTALKRTRVQQLYTPPTNVINTSNATLDH